MNPRIKMTVVTALALSACGEPTSEENGANGPSTDPEPLTVSDVPLPQTDLPNAFARASCTAYGRCACEWSELVACTQDGVCFEDEAACVARFEQAAEVEFGGSPDAYDAIVARECVNTILTSPCEDANWFEICGGIFGGGAAVAPERAVVGEACNGTCIGDVGEGYCRISLNGSGTKQCAFDAGGQCQGGTCASLRSAGVACDDQLQCEPPLACVAGTCGARLASGETCSPEPENPCVMGSYCDGSVCIPQVAHGSACAEDDECETNYCDQVCLNRGQEPVCSL